MDRPSGLSLYRAEQLGEQIFDLFSPPPYWTSLLGAQPVFLTGGRGTGKTHALRALSFEGQYRLNGEDFSRWESLGAYWRVDTSTAAVFQGSTLNEDQWTRLFGHFVNLHLLGLVLEFESWRKEVLRVPTAVDGRELSRAAASLGIQDHGRVVTIDSFADAVRDELATFEGKINRVGSAVSGHGLSVVGVPVKRLLDALAGDDVYHSAGMFTFCIDEFENLQDYQQRVLNTLVKHAGDGRFTFKIGAKMTGHRTRTTLSPNEFLYAPADYVHIDVVQRLKDADFSDFAASVVLSRLRSDNPGINNDFSMTRLLPELSIENEAVMLGAEQVVKEVRDRLVSEGTALDVLAHFDSLPVLEQYLVDYWAQSKRIDVKKAVQEAIADPAKWSVRTGNYAYAMLFTMKRGKVGVRKYYSGWATFVRISDGNIRFLLNLVSEAIRRHEVAKEVLGPVPPSVQTEAARAVGGDFLQELQGLDVRGAQLQRLALGLGRVFEVFAADPYGHAPEVSQFRFSGDPQEHEGFHDLLSSAILHSCLVRYVSDKRALVSPEVRDFDYQLHPIFAPFFGYSHRSKRRMSLEVGDFLALASRDSRAAINRLLKRSHRGLPAEDSSAVPLFSYFESLS